MKRGIYLTSVFLFLTNILNGELRILKPGIQGKTSFAIFVDSITFNKCSSEIIEYKNSVEKENLPAYVLIDNWESPEQIKSEIIKLYNTNNRLEGVVFIGDIPIPMIREAQHLTSAFKIDEYRFSYVRSSVPSDRFYDDFDLKFEFLGQDSLNKLYFYYRLQPDSPQRIEKEIYSARIKPSPDSLKYMKMKEYLTKVSKIKSIRNRLDNILVFTGHGYNSEALTAWADETLILNEHFPGAFLPGGRFKKYFYDMNKEVKKVILAELENPEIDIAIFHAHGETDAQLLSSNKKAVSINEYIESIKFYLRSKLRSFFESGKSIQEIKEYFKKSFSVPDEWFEGAFDIEIIKKDSLLVYDQDIHIQDIRKLKPQAKFIVFDECFNGSFHLDEYIAGEYVFGDGNTICALGNSVNVLQDLFVTELMGLLRLGFSVGQWHLLNNYLESHLIGDPTFKFYSESNIINSFNLQLNEKTLNKLLSSPDAIIRSFALKNLFNLKREKLSTKLKEIYLNDNSPNVRLMALKCLAEIRNESFEETLMYSINDPNELIRRFSVIWMGLIGKNEFIPLIVRAAFGDESDRVRYNAKSVIELLNSPSSIEIIRTESQKIMFEKIKYGFDTSKFFFRIPDERRQNEIFQTILSDTIKLNRKISEARTFRRYNYESAIDSLISLLRNNSLPLELRVVIAEALGWNTFSKNRNKIVEECQSILLSVTELKLRNELLKTINRLREGANNPLTP